MVNHVNGETITGKHYRPNCGRCDVPPWESCACSALLEPDAPWTLPNRSARISSKYTPEQTHLQRVCWLSGVFDARSLTDIQSRLGRFDLGPATVMFEEGAAARHQLQPRRSAVAWVLRDDATKDIHTSLIAAVREANERFFAYELSGFAAPLQFAVYSVGDYFDWHIDASPMTGMPRKLSVTVQLSDPDEYDGGDLEFFVDGSEMKAPREKGTVVVFPSYTSHRVTPITRGVRKSLVCWCTGPQFK